MASKIKRGFLIRRYYCSDCNKRVGKGDTVCQGCGHEFVGPPKDKRPAVKRRPAAEPEPVEEEIPEEIPEEMPEEELEQPAEQELGGPLPKKGWLKQLPLRKATWAILFVLVLWGFFTDDTVVFIASILLLVVIEADVIMRKRR